MFERPTQLAFERQLREQREHVIAPLQAKLQVDLVRQVALLPRKLVKQYNLTNDAYVMTWEDVVDAYTEIMPDSHFLGTLRLALAGDHAAPPSTKGQFSDMLLTGWEIYRRRKDPDFPCKAVGRIGGEYGDAFIKDILTGSWMTQMYELSVRPQSNRTNRFPVQHFIEAVQDYAELTKTDPPP